MTHEVLKLSALRLSPFLLRWIVGINGMSSGTTPVVSGVPQRSILGPLLFLIYVNDITEIQLSGSHLLPYADDVLLYRPIQSQADDLLLQADIDKLYMWSVSNILHFNPSKCIFYNHLLS